MKSGVRRSELRKSPAEANVQAVAHTFSFGAQETKAGIEANLVCIAGFWPVSGQPLLPSETQSQNKTKKQGRPSGLA